MINNNVVAIAISGIAGHRYGAIGSRINGSSLRRGKVESGMELCCLVHRVDPIAKTRGDPAEVFIADGLNGWRTGQQLCLVLDKAVDLGIGFSLTRHS